MSENRQRKIHLPDLNKWEAWVRESQVPQTVSLSVELCIAVVLSKVHFNQIGPVCL